MTPLYPYPTISALFALPPLKPVTMCIPQGHFHHSWELSYARDFLVPLLGAALLGFDAEAMPMNFQCMSRAWGTQCCSAPTAQALAVFELFPALHRPDQLLEQIAHAMQPETLSAATRFPAYVRNAQTRATGNVSWDSFHNCIFSFIRLTHSS